MLAPPATLRRSDSGPQSSRRSLHVSRAPGQRWGLSIVPKRGLLSVSSVTLESPLKTVLSTDDLILAINGFPPERISDVRMVFANAIALHLLVDREPPTAATELKGGPPAGAASLHTIHQVLGEPRRSLVWEREALQRVFDEERDGVNGAFHAAIEGFLSREQEAAVTEPLHTRSEAAVQGALEKLAQLGGGGGGAFDGNRHVLPGSMPAGLQNRVWCGEAVKRSREPPSATDSSPMSASAPVAGIAAAHGPWGLPVEQGGMGIMPSPPPVAATPYHPAAAPHQQPMHQQPYGAQSQWSSPAAASQKFPFSDVDGSTQPEYVHVEIRGTRRGKRGKKKHQNGQS